MFSQQAAFKERTAPSIFTALNTRETSLIRDRYNVSKLLEILVVRELAPLISPENEQKQKVVLNCVNPGLCYSSLSRDAPSVLQWVMNGIKAVLARTAEVGGGIFVWAVAAGEESNGKFISECVVTEPSAWVRSEEGAQIQKKVWSELSAILEGIQPGITKNI